MILFMDPDNSVIRLCAKGMECEMRGQIEEASELFRTAWDQSSDDFERCIAAHYVARHQKTAVETLWWNQEALQRANASDPLRVEALYPSLYLNLGKSHEDLGNVEEAKRFYQSAAERVDRLPPDAYGSMVRHGIARGLERVSD